MPPVVQSDDAQQVHVSIVGVERVVVSWASPNRIAGMLFIEEVDDEGQPVPDTLLSLRPNSTEYALQSTDGSGPYGALGIYHSPLLLHCDVPIKPRAKYRYRIATSVKSSPSAGRDSEAAGWRRFQTPPGPGAEQSLRLAVVGDLGQTNFSQATCRSIRSRHEEEAFDAAILLGDLAYADGYQDRWDSFGRMFEDFGCADLPWLVFPGNHEIDLDNLTGEAFIPYRHRWRTPTVAPESVGNFTVHSWLTYDFSGRYDFGGSFYSISLGPAHFIVLNPYTDAGEDSPQISWLREELQRVNRSATPYLIVLTHAPWRHSSAKHQPSVEFATQRLKEAAEPLVLAAGADLFFSGHVHAYERMKPVGGMRNFVVGHGGNQEELYNEWTPNTQSEFHDGTQYGWGELQLDAENTSHYTAWASMEHAKVDFVLLAADASSRDSDFLPVGSEALPALLLLLFLLAATGCGMASWSQWQRRRSRLLGSRRQKSFSEQARVLGANRM